MPLTNRQKVTASVLRIASEVDRAAWNEALASFGGNIFHTPEWADFVTAEQPSVRPEFYTMVDPDGLVAGLAVGFRTRSSRNPAATFKRRRSLDAFPATRDSSMATASTFLDLVETDCRRAGDVTLRVGSFASPGGEATLASLGYSIARRLEFELDLTEDHDSLWQKVDLKRRQRIRKAMKSGIEVRELPVDEGVRHLRRLQDASSVRISARGGPSRNRREFAGGDPVTGLVGAGLGRVVGGFVDGECVSASFFTTFNGIAYLALSGHDERGLATQAPSLVLWEMVLRFRDQGFKTLNLGGCGIGALDETSSEHGVYTYKKAFGGRQLECASGELVLRPAIRRVTSLLRDLVG